MNRPGIVPRSALRWLVAALAAVAIATVVPEFGTAQVGSAPTSPTSDGGTIAVSGEGEASASPDVAYVSVGVQTEAASAAQASEENSRRMAAVLEALRAHGVRSQNLQTRGLTVSPRFGPEGREIVGYQATNTVTVTVEMLERAGQLLDAALAAGANQVGGLRFGIKDPSSLRAQALAEAARVARAKADTLAAALGVRIVGVERIAEEGSRVPVPRMADAARASVAAEAPAPPVERGELRVTAQVQVVFRFE
jgi:uncharacterized protein YggE